MIVAAGMGRRLGAANEVGPKALMELGGRTLLELALGTLAAVPEIADLVVVHPPGHREAFAPLVGPEVVLVPGGRTRTDSVRAGLAALPDGAAVVAVHDAARPLVPTDVVVEVLAAVGGEVVAAAPGLPLTDTVKRVEGDGTVTGTVDRAGLWTVHTPQVVRRDVLELALAQGLDAATDDLGLVERLLESGDVSGRVLLVRGDPRAMKITYPQDLVVAEALLAADRRWSE